MILRRARAVLCAAAPRLAASALLLSCSERRSAPNATTQPSPNASILPAPLASTAELATPAAPSATAVDSAGHLTAGDPEPPPEAAPVDHALPEDTAAVHDATGFTIEGAFRWADLPPVVSGPDGPATSKETTSKLELAFVVDLAAGRMRFSFESLAFPLPEHTELRARTGYYGHVLVWPDATAYRVVPPGSLRALFAERRADVAPLLRAVMRPGANGMLLGHRTVQTELETSLGVLSLEQATSPGGSAGELLCRLLVELVGAEPSNDACRPERVPLYAQYRWTGGGSIAYVATSIGDRRDAPATTLSVPPAGARWAPGELPLPRPMLLTADELGRFKARAAVHAGAGAKAAHDVTCANETNLLQYLVLDGVPVVWVAPRAREHVLGLPPGRYQVAWRDFFGTAVTPPTGLDLPGFVRVGAPEPDGGARP
jgi:hypothetical protein